MKLFLNLLLISLPITFCSNKVKNINTKPETNIYIYFKNMNGGSYVYKNMKIELLSDFDSVIVDTDDSLIIVDIITPEKMEYNLVFLPYENLFFNFSDDTKSIVLNSNLNISYNVKLFDFYNSLYGQNGLNEKIKREYSDSLTQLTKSGKTDKLYYLLNDLLNYRIDLAERFLNNKETFKAKNYIKSDAKLSMYNSFLKRGFQDSFTSTLIDSLFLYYKSVDSKTFLSNPHYNLLLVRLISSSYRESNSYPINSYAYDCFENFLHPSVKFIKMKFLAENSLDNGDSTYAIRYLKDCDDLESKESIMFKLFQLRKNNPQESLFENEYLEKINLTDILKQFSADMLVVDIWASWCPPCIGELKNYDSLKSKYLSLNADLLIISIDNRHDSWLATHSKLNLPKNRSFRILSNQKTFFQKEIVGIPYKFIITKEGKVIHPVNQTVDDYLVSAKQKKRV